ncbi:MAG TPA: hypothetical protein PLD25_12495 [Chloroflexota bacterium]|nr:hypothetical protein [Chloroflexota bacterium]HUM71165.1 hypothetical protein [Chloroflexota bacterium]
MATSQPVGMLLPPRHIRLPVTSPFTAVPLSSLRPLTPSTENGRHGIMLLLLNNIDTGRRKGVLMLTTYERIITVEELAELAWQAQQTAP